MLKVAETDREIEGCFDVMSELRPHLVREEFVALVRGMQTQGYRLAFVEQDGAVVAVAGYRIATSLHLGKHLYLNDLVTTARARSGGHGARLIGWLRDQARDADCGFFDLDSGTQRVRAHKFYFEQGFHISSFHFSEELVD
jgi:GNAT superfamily N-acetyltransferase